MRIKEIDQTLITYHVSPLPYFTGDRKKDCEKSKQFVSDWLQLEDNDSNNDRIKKLNKLYDIISTIEKGDRYGDNGNAKPNQIYVSSQPEFWMDMQKDESGLIYDFGGIYVIHLKRPITYNMVNGGGLLAPEALITKSNIASIIPPNIEYPPTKVVSKTLIKNIDTYIKASIKEKKKFLQNVKDKDMQKFGLNYKNVSSLRYDLMDMYPELFRSHPRFENDAREYYASHTEFQGKGMTHILDCYYF